MKEPINIYRWPLFAGNRGWTLWASDKGLIRLSYEQDEGKLPAAWLKTYAPLHTIAEDRNVFADMGAIALLEQYFAGEKTDFSGLPLDLWGTPFQREVWGALAEVPYGVTASYGDLAVRIGRPKAVRAVGTANGQNPVPVIVPCHRIIGTNGTLTGYRGGLQLKQELLALEGITGVGATGHERFAF